MLSTKCVRRDKILIGIKCDWLNIIVFLNLVKLLETRETKVSLQNDHSTEFLITKM